MTILEAYRHCGKNFMTPQVLKVKFFTDRVVELSKGEGFTREPIWGVTELIIDNGERIFNKPDRSKLCFTEHDAVNYYEELCNV